MTVENKTESNQDTLTTENEKELDRLLGGKEHRIALTGEFDKMADRMYARGVSDGREQARNPNHKMRVPSGAEASTIAPVPKTPEQLSARAREIQDDAAKNGRRVSNIESVRMAYAEANIPWQ
jgi:hypothetical protein